MKSSKLIVAGLFPVILFPFWAPPVQAAATSAVVHVQARVRPWISFSADQLVTTYQVSEEDIRRGYLDLARAVSIRLRTNIPDDIQIAVASGGQELILVHGDGGSPARELSIGGNHPAVPVTRVLDMRIVLPPEAMAGTYPLRVALAPQAY